MGSVNSEVELPLFFGLRLRSPGTKLSPARASMSASHSLDPTGG